MTAAQRQKNIIEGYPADVLQNKIVNLGTMEFTEFAFLRLMLHFSWISRTALISHSDHAKTNQSKMISDNEVEIEEETDTKCRLRDHLAKL